MTPRVEVDTINPMKNKLDPKNESHWMTHANHEARRDTNPLTATGAPMPCATSPLWNEWAANNSTPEAKALAAFDPSDMLMASIKGITTGARPVNW